MEAKTKNILKIVGAIALVATAVVVYKKYYKTENKSEAGGGSYYCKPSWWHGGSGYFSTKPCPFGFRDISNQA